MHAVRRAWGRRRCSLQRRAQAGAPRRTQVEPLEARQLLAGDLLITEFMAANDTTIQDQDGRYSDWLEIHNPTAAAISLEGWHLTDDPDRLDKWEFSKVTVPAGGYLVAFASGKDRDFDGYRLVRDFNSMNDGTFVVDLPGGRYDIRLTLGDATRVHDQMAIHVQGELRDIISTRMGEFVVWRTEAEVSGAGGPLAIRLQDLGGETGQAVINALVITPTTGGAPLQFDFGPPDAPLEPGYLPISAADTYDPQASPGWLPDSVVGEKDRGLNKDEPHTDFQLAKDGEYLALVSPAGVVVSEFGLNGSDYPPQIDDVSYGLPVASTPLLTDGMSFSYQVPTVEDALLGTSWTEPEFDDWFWTTTNDVGLSQGVGFIAPGGSDLYTSLFATNVGDAMWQENASIWLRQEFQVDDPTAFAGLTLRVQYNDGFVAFLNGVPVASANAPESLQWNSVATAIRSATDAVVLQDFFIGPETAGLAVGKNVLAIQGLNQLVDDTDLLIRPQLIAATPIDVDSGIGAGFLSRPTPGVPNTLLRSTIVTFDRPSGVFQQPFTLTLSTDTPDAKIHFTTDGSTPSETSAVHTEPITIDATTYVQAIAVAPGFAAGAPLGEWFIKLDQDLEPFTSNLPIVVLDNFGAGGVGETTFQLHGMAIYQPDAGTGRSSLAAAPELESRVGLKIRGSNSAGKPKRHYAVEAWDEYHQDRRIAPLGMPADSDWILLPSYDTDRALIANAFPFEVNSQMGRYAPRTRFVEVYHNLDGGNLSSLDYQGVYVLIEKIKLGPNRVDIVELEPQDEAEPEISGGWLLKDDRPDPGDEMICGRACVEPKEENVTPIQAAWIRDYLSALTASAMDPDPETGYAKYIDVDSWIDYHVLNTMMNNTDVFQNSTYFFKDRGGKMEMGPIWDFDRSLGYEDNVNNSPYIWRSSRQ